MLNSSTFQMYQESLEPNEPGGTSVDDKMLRSVTTEAQIPAEEEGFYGVSTVQVHLVV